MSSHVVLFQVVLASLGRICGRSDWIELGMGVSIVFCQITGLLRLVGRWFVAFVLVAGLLRLVVSAADCPMFIIQHLL